MSVTRLARIGALAVLLCASLAGAQVPVSETAGQPSGSEFPLGPESTPDARHGAVVLVLHATNSGKGIDARIRDMPELSRPPFSSYDSYELLSEHQVPLAKGQPRSLELPNGRVLRAELKEVLADRFVRLSASIDQPDGKTFLPLLEVKAKLGQAFIVAGQSYRNGILVLVIRVNELTSSPAGEQG